MTTAPVTSAYTLRHRQFRRILWASIMLPIALLTGAALLLSWAVGRLLKDADALRESDEIVAVASTCLKLAVDMETGLRGFQLTGRREMLEPYLQAAPQIETQFAALQNLARTDVEVLQRVKQSHARWQAFATDTINRRSRSDDVSGYEINARGKELFDAFRDDVGRFIAEQEERKRMRSAALSQLDGRVLQFRLALLLGLGAVIGGIVWWQISRVARMFREAQGQAERRAETLQVTLRSIGDGVIATDASGRITFVNAVAADLTGWRETEAGGRPLGDVLRLLQSQPAQHASDPVGEVLARGQSVELPADTALATKDGREIAIAATAAPIREDDGTISGVVTVFHDVSGERAAAATRAKLATIVESTFEAIIGTHPDGTIYEWNRGAEQLFGYTAREIIGQPVTRLAPPERAAEVESILEQARNGRPTVALNTTRMRRDGSPIDVSVTVSPIRDAAGNVVGSAKVVHDISDLTKTMGELREAERSLLIARADLERKVEERTLELFRALEKAREVDRLKSEFLATMSHELRTPLNSIIGFTEIVLAGIPGPINDEQRRQLTMSHSSARHLLHLINDLLDLARIESGRVEPVWEDFPPQEVIEEAIATMQPLADRKRLKLVTDLQLPGLVRLDRKMYFQILLNLLNNAVKFTDAGEVRLTCRVEGGVLVNRVTDTGIGIRPEQLGLLFEAFRQVDGTSRRRYEGTGLGLYLCKRLVRLLGGEIRAESVFGTGSVFTFTVPVHQPTAA